VFYAAEFQGLWENLMYEDDMKSQVLIRLTIAWWIHIASCRLASVVLTPCLWIAAAELHTVRASFR